MTIPNWDDIWNFIKIMGGWLVFVLIFIAAADPKDSLRK